MSCQAQSVTNVTAWATLLGNVPWAVVQDPGDEVAPEVSSCSFFGSMIFEVYIFFSAIPDSIDRVAV